MMEKCLIDRTRLIEYNQIKSHVKMIDVLKLMNTGRKIDVWV